MVLTSVMASPILRLSCLRIDDSWSDWKKRKAVLDFFTSGAMLDVRFVS